MDHNDHKSVHLAEAKPPLSHLWSIPEHHKLNTTITKVCIWLKPNHRFHICDPTQMEHDEHKSVHLAEAKQPRRALESSGELWRALASSGEFWRALASSGEFWRALQSYTCLGGKTAAAPSTFTLGLRIRQVGRKYPPLKIVFWS